MKRLGLKYISSTGVNFPAVNSGRWNLATNFKGNFNRILTESGIDAEDDESVALYMRFTETGMLLCAARRCFPVGEPTPHFQTLWMFVPDSILISNEHLSKAAMELAGIFDHPEAFTSIEAFEDILPPIFRKDFEEENSGEEEPSEEDKAAEEAGKKLEREIFEAFSGFGKEKAEEKEEQARRKMTGERIGYVGYDNITELEIILSAGYIPQYANFGLIYLTDYPIRVESLLPGLFHPELILHRQIERDRIREEEERKRREEEALKEAEELEAKLKEEAENREENPTEGSEEAGEKVENQPDSADSSDPAKENEEGEKEKKEDTGEGGTAVEDLTPQAAETVDKRKEKWSEDLMKKVKGSYAELPFWIGFTAATILYLLIYIVVQLCR